MYCEANSHERWLYCSRMELCNKFIQLFIEYSYVFKVKLNKQRYFWHSKLSLLVDKIICSKDIYTLTNINLDLKETRTSLCSIIRYVISINMAFGD